MRRLDSWLPPTIELWVGCIILVLSASFWMSEDAGPIWDLKHWPTNVGAILGPLFVYRAWKRKRGEIKCNGCGNRVPIVPVDDKSGRSYLIIDCPDCGLYAPPDASRVHLSELADSDVARRVARIDRFRRAAAEWHRQKLEAGERTPQAVENERDDPS